MCALLSELAHMNFWNVLKFEGKLFLLNLYIAQEKIAANKIIEALWSANVTFPWAAYVKNIPCKQQGRGGAA